MFIDVCIATAKQAVKVNFAKGTPQNSDPILEATAPTVGS